MSAQNTAPTFLETRIHGLMRLAPAQYTGTVHLTEKGIKKTVELPHYKNVWKQIIADGVKKDFEAIEINFTDIYGNQIYLDKGTGKGKPFSMLRWNIIPPDRDQDRKYEIPASNGTRPFFPQYLKQCFESGMQYDHLVITEGAFKADVATNRGMFTVGLTSITHSADAADKNSLHNDILEIIRVNQPRRITIVWDGDCREFGKKDYEAGNDLNRRPKQFYDTARAIFTKLRDSGYTHEIYFAHPASYKLKDNPKGLDDLYLTADSPQLIKDDLYSAHTGETAYFYKINISSDLSTLARYLHQDGVDTFYNYNRLKLKDAPFTYDGTKYKWDTEEGRCIMLFSRELRDYFRCGDKYYRKLKRLNAYGAYDEIIEPYDKAALIEDFGKEQVKWITKYKSFITIPDHFNHKQIIDNCYNRYYPFGHRPDEVTSIEDFEKNSTTFKYIRHAFGANEETGMQDHVQMFLDYFKLLYEKPMVKLPALCLISREKNTGKSTLLRWLRQIFTMNMIVIGNSTLNDQFNATWSSKLIVGIDEALIEKIAILEMIKSLMTETKIVVRRMQREGTQEDFFAKFILNSNNVLNFIFIDKYEDRFWVRYVPKYSGEEDTTFEEKLFAEIPQFLQYILQRSLVHKKASRFWFPKKLYDTTALQKVVEASRSGTEKNLEEALEKEFNRPCNDKLQHLHFTKKDLIELIQQNVGEREQLKNVRRTLIQLGYPDTANSIPYTKTFIEFDSGKPTVTTRTEYGRAYKFKRGKGLEMFEPAKEKPEAPADTKEAKKPAPVQEQLINEDETPF